MPRPKKAKSPSLLLGRLRKHFPKITRVKDANTLIKVHVKEGDCRSAVGGSFNECALARATKREFKADGCLIGLAFSYVVKGKTATRYITPVSVAREMVSFDRHHDFDAGVYHLASVPDSVRLGTLKHKTGGNRGGDPNPKRHPNVHRSARVRRVSKETS